jgi:transcription elongation factor Elf1
LDYSAEEPCESCGHELEVIWRVSIKNSLPGYASVLPTGSRDIAQCGSCGARFERFGTGDWERQTDSR